MRPLYLWYTFLPVSNSLSTLSSTIGDATTPSSGTAPPPNPKEHNASTTVDTTKQGTCTSNHKDYIRYKAMEDSRYFKNEYYEKNKFAVRCCARCDLSFKSGTGFTTVHACSQAFQPEDECMHALCAKCMASEMEKSNSQQGCSRRRRRLTSNK
jgi:hypothetical protein